MTKKIAILNGDGIGPEIVAQAVKVLDKLIEQGLDVSYKYAKLGGEAYDTYGLPYPSQTQEIVQKADAVLLGRLVRLSTMTLTAHCVLSVDCLPFARI